MNIKLFFISLVTIVSGYAQTSKKPFAFMGSYTINYEVKKAGTTTPVKGNVVCAFNGYDAAFIPSFANTLQDIAAAKLLVNTNFNEITMLSTMKTGKKNGLLTVVPKPVLENKTVKPPVITKTTLTKSIQSLPCQKTIITYSDSTKAEAWTTNALVLPLSDAVQFINLGFKNKSPLYNVNINALNTTSLETVIMYKNGDVITLSISDIKKVKPDAAFFKSDGYNILDARGLQMR